MERSEGNDWKLSKSEWCIAGFYLFCLAILASILPSHFGFPLDDSWIHQTVARNLAERHVLGYLPGVTSSGSSSLLWTWVLALGYMLPLNPVIFCTIIHGFMFALIGVLLKRLAGEGPEAWVIAACPALCGNFMWLGLVGMECVLFVLLSLLAVQLWFSGANAVWVGVALGLLAITRPEGILLSPILVLLRPRRTWTDVAKASVTVIPFVLVNLFINWRTSRSLLPQTMQGRLWLAVKLSGGLEKARFLCAAQWFTRLLKTWHIFSGSALFGFASPILLGVIVLFLGIPIVLAIARLYHRPKLWAICLWWIAINLVYLIVLPSTGQGGRYQPFQLFLPLSLFFAGLYYVIKNRWVIGALIVVSGVLSLSTWRGAAIADIDQINNEHGAMARWLAEQPKETLAVFDIGRIGYELRGNLIDLGGLVDKSFLPYLKEGRVSEYLAAKGVQTVVLPTTDEPSDIGIGTLLNLDPKTLIPVKTFCDERKQWEIAMLSSNTALPCQRAFRFSR